MVCHRLTSQEFLFQPSTVRLSPQSIRMASSGSRRSASGLDFGFWMSRFFALEVHISVLGPFGPPFAGDKIPAPQVRANALFIPHNRPIQVSISSLSSGGDIPELTYATSGLRRTLRERVRGLLLTPRPPTVRTSSSGCLFAAWCGVDTTPNPSVLRILKKLGQLALRHQDFYGLHATAVYPSSHQRRSCIAGLATTSV